MVGKNGWVCQNRPEKGSSNCSLLLNGGKAGRGHGHGQGRDFSALRERRVKVAGPCFSRRIHLNLNWKWRNLGVHDPSPKASTPLLNQQDNMQLK